MSTERFRYLTVIEIEYEPAEPDYITGRWEDSVEGIGERADGVLIPADDGNEELPGFLANAIRAALETEAGKTWMTTKMREVVR